MKTLLSIAFCFFFSLSIYAQNTSQTDSVSLPVSPLFNSAKINEPGDPYFQKTGLGCDKYYLLFQVAADGQHYAKQAIPESAAKSFLSSSSSQ